MKVQLKGRHSNHRVIIPWVMSFLCRKRTARHLVAKTPDYEPSNDRACHHHAVSSGGQDVRSGRDVSRPILSAPRPDYVSKASISANVRWRIMLALAATMVPFMPALSGVPFVTDDADSPDAGHFEINLAAQYTRFQGGSNAAIPSLEINYGATNKLELIILTPLGLSHVDGVGTNVGVGDIELGVKYRFIDADDWGWRPAVAFAPSITMPSGNEVRGLGDGRMQGFLAIWLSKDINQWTMFGGGGYNINPGPDRLNWWFAGLGITRELDPTWTIGAEIYYTTPEGQGLKNSTAFNIGAIYNISDMHHLMISAGRNLINARENNEFSTYIGYQLTF